MIQLKNSLSAWNTANFSTIFKQEVESLSIDQLCLQQALKIGSCASMDNFQIMINRQQEQQENIIIDCGIFYSSSTPGCNCSDDPTSPDLNNEYGDFRFSIDKISAETTISLVN